MKTLKLITLAAFALLFSQCKTTSPTAPTGPAPSLLEVNQILDTTASKFFQFGDSTKGSPQQAIILTENWLKTQPTVLSADNVDSAYIYIQLKSGLKTVFNFVQIGNDSLSVFRGAPTKKSAPPLKRVGPESLHTITNKKVLIFCPPIEEFYRDVSGMQNNLDLFTNSGLGFDVTLVTGTQCSYHTVDNFKDYGLVIIDTHGSPDGFQTGTIITSNEGSEADLKQYFDAQLGAGSYGRFIAGELELHNAAYVNDKKLEKLNKIKKTVWLHSKYIAALTGMENTVIFGNMCYSGWSVPQNGNLKIIPIAGAFTGINPISYYCYAFANGKSTLLENNFAKSMENSLIRRLVISLDSTGSAYKKSDGTEFVGPTRPEIHYLGDFLFKHFGADDYSYVKCSDPFTDERDGQIYKTVCIGTQIWMAQNLNYNAPGSHCYQNNSGNCDTYGRLYDMTTMTGGQGPSNSNPSGVQGVCPKGWHVPSSNEFSVLQSFLGFDDGGAMKAVSSLWASPNTGATNSSGFTALPGGHAFDSTWSGLGQEAWFGSTSTIFVSPSNYWLTFGVRANSSTFDANQALELPPLNWYTSCRCVKDP